ncbi:hypothetical protein Tco_0130778, partial [Tanacetum coccineum]
PEKEKEKQGPTLLMALPEDHLAKFHKMTNVKEMWEAIKSRFGGNDESKKMQKFQSLLSQLEIHDAGKQEKEKDNGRISGIQEDSKALVTLDGEGVDWTSHSEDEQENYAFMACNSSGSDIEAYTQALKKVEAQLVAHQQSQLWYEEKIRFMKIDLDDKTDVLTYHKKLLAEVEKEKEKEDLKAKIEKWHNFFKILVFC